MFTRTTRVALGALLAGCMAVAAAPLAAIAGGSGPQGPGGHGGTGPTGTRHPSSAAPVAGAPTTPQALILDDSVTGGTSSEEADAAVADGFTVTDVTGAVWDTMTTTDFRKYQVLIIGDPTCDYSGASFAAAVTDAATWQAAVMGSGGNRVLIGTDPTFHTTAHPGAQVLEQSGIGYAGANAGSTGVYVDLSCAYSGVASGTPVPWINGLSRVSGAKFTVTGPPCSGNIAIVAQSGPTASLQDTDLSNWFCSVHEAFDGYPADFFPLAISTDSGEATYSATDVGTPGGGTVSGSPYIMVAGTGLSISSNITLNPPTQSQLSFSSASVTATATQAGSPVVGTPITIQIVAGPNNGKKVVANSNINGQLTWVYSDTGPGTDQLVASFVDATGATEEALASVTWLPPDTTKLTATPVIASLTPLAVYLPTLSAKLVDVTRGNEPLAGRKVTFSSVGLGTLLGTTLCVSSTDAHGVATCGGLTVQEVQAILGLGYNVTFANSPGLKGSSAHAPALSAGSLNIL